MKKINKENNVTEYNIRVIRYRTVNSLRTAGPVKRLIS